MDEKEMRFLFYSWLLTSLILLVAPFFAPGYVVLGNDKMMSFVAALTSGLVVTLLTKAFLKLSKKYFKLHKTSEALMLLTLLVGYVVFTWVVARAAIVFGLGIASFWVAIGLGVVLGGGEYLLFRSLGSTPKVARSNVRKSTKKRRR